MTKSKWVEITISVPAEFVEPVMELFLTYGKSSPIIEETGGFNPDEGEVQQSGLPVKVTTYLRANHQAQKAREQIEIGVRLLALLGPVSELKVRTLEATEWEEAWRLHHKPFRLGRRLVVWPLGQPYTPSDSDVVIRLDPGLAFGTGFHPTTAMCLEEIERRVTVGSKVLDLGSGSGILSVTAAKLGAGEIIAMDIDQMAVRATRKNSRLNDYGKKIRVVQGTIPKEGLSGVQVLVANISAKVLIELSTSLVAALDPDGVLIASGFLDERFQDVIVAFREAGLCLIERRDVDDWVTITLKIRREEFLG